MQLRPLRESVFLPSPDPCGSSSSKAGSCGKRLFDPLDEGTRSENLPHRGGMDPDGSFLGKIRKASQSLEEFSAPVVIEEAPYKKIGACDQEK